MAAKAKSGDSSFDRARQSFQDLDLQDRAVFLVEAAVSTLAKGLEDATETLSEEIDALLKKMAQSGEPGEQDEPQETSEHEAAGKPEAEGAPAGDDASEEAAGPSSGGKRKRRAS